MVRNALVLVVSILFSLVLAEVIVRLIFGTQFQPRPAFWSRDEDLGWRYSSNLDAEFFGSDYSIHVRTDKYGYRIDKLGEPDSTSPLVLLVGDSYTFGWGVDDDETYASFLDEMLWDSVGYRAVNLGTDGYGTIQYSRALERFVSLVQPDRIIGVIVLHASNDATDNVRFGLYESGNWSYRSLPSNSNPLHLVNLVQRLLTVRLITEGRDDSDQEQHGFPVNVNFPEEEWFIDGEPVSRDDISSRRMRERMSLTEIQRRLILRSVNELHRTLADRDVAIVHGLVHYDDGEWFEQELGALIGQSDSYGNTIVYTGRVPLDASCTQCGENEHSGEHFNPALNDHYARFFLRVLTSSHVFESRPSGLAQPR